MARAFDHVVLEVKDVEAAVAFYDGLLGFAPVRLEDFRAGAAPFPSVRVNADTLIDFFPRALWQRKTRPANPNHICFTLSQTEVAGLRKKMKARGLPVERTLRASFGARGMGRSVYFRDPEGNLLEVRYYP